ncbi:hypothetical protein G3A43_06965 [Paraburkholderia aspalathi]|nr:hypothetical protein [Paraburkholderia aspalathi]MBK3779992.1 hypothetical protein [Paraburkholderia aspalathi]
MLTMEALESLTPVASFWTMPARSQSGQFSKLDNFMLVNVRTNVAVESHFGPGRASRACNVLNEHATRNSHLDRYEPFRVLKEVKEGGVRT